MKENATAETTVENWVSQRDQAKAQLELAQINLGYTEVTAPFDGRLGARQVDPGNLVGSTGPTILATIEQLQPIYVNFNLNERDALHLRDLMRQPQDRARLEHRQGAGRGRSAERAGLSPRRRPRLRRQRALDLDGNDRPARPSSRTRTRRSSRASSPACAFPCGGRRGRMLVIPASAVGNDQQGDFVYVVDANDVVERRAIVKGPMTANGPRDPQRRRGGDRVIVNGLLNARVGEKVAPADGAGRAGARADR